MSILKVEKLNAGYGKKNIVKDASLLLNSGEMVALIGENGCGKSTLMKSLCGLINYNGSSCVDNLDINKLDEKQKSCLVSYIPQRCGVSISISAIDVVLMGINNRLNIFGKPSIKDKEIAMEILKVVNMEKYAYKNFQHLSEGQKQLVILSRALIQNTKLLVFDEPDSALDYNNKHLLLSAIRNMIKEKNKAALLCLHDVNLAMQYCDRIILMKDGKIIDNIDLGRVTKNMLEKALSKVYINIDIINFKGRFVMLRQEYDEMGFVAI